MFRLVTADSFTLEIFKPKRPSRFGPKYGRDLGTEKGDDILKTG